MNEIEEKLGITAEMKAKVLWETALACKEGKADKDGLIHPSGVTSAISELNKMQGHYAVEKKDIVVREGLAEQLTEQYKKGY